MYFIKFKTPEQANAIIAAHGVLGFRAYMYSDGSDFLIKRYLEVFPSCGILVDEEGQHYTVMPESHATDGAYGELEIKTYEEWNA